VRNGDGKRTRGGKKKKKKKKQKKYRQFELYFGFELLVVAQVREMMVNLFAKH